MLYCTYNFKLHTCLLLTATTHFSICTINLKRSISTMSKVTMQDIADELGISRVTVWKVFNNHSGVSEAVRESILQKAKELGYSKFMQEPAAIPNDPQEDKTVSLIVSRPDSSTFWTNIIHRLAQELATHNINLLYTYVPSSYTPSYSFPSALTNGTVSGAIILNVYDTKMVELITL